METISKKGRFTLKQILKENWDSFLDVHGKQVTWYMAYNVWKVMNCREPEGLGYATFACPDHPEQTCHIPRSCKSRFCSVWAKIQIDKWVADMIHQLLTSLSPTQHASYSPPAIIKQIIYISKKNLVAIGLSIINMA